MSHKKLFQDCKDAIDALFSDTAVSQQTTLADLRDLSSEIEIKMECIKSDLKRKKRPETQGEAMTNIKPIQFTRRVPPCPKCGSRKVLRHYCLGEHGDCADVLRGDATRGKEHFDLNCQECRFEWYMKVKS